MHNKLRKNNVIAFWLAIVSSIFLFISGTTGVTNWIKIEDVVLKYANFHFINILFSLLLIIASFGGIIIIIGGILILKGKVFLGDLMILLGSGTGLIGFFLNLFIAIVAFNFSIYSYLSFSALGVIFALSAQIVSGNNKKKWWYKKSIKSS